MTDPPRVPSTDPAPYVEAIDRTPHTGRDGGTETSPRLAKEREQEIRHVIETAKRRNGHFRDDGEGAELLAELDATRRELEDSKAIDQMLAPSTQRNRGHLVAELIHGEEAKLRVEQLEAALTAERARSARLRALAGTCEQKCDALLTDLYQREMPGVEIELRIRALHAELASLLKDGEV